MGAAALGLHLLSWAALLIWLGCAAGVHDPLYGDINTTNYTGLRLLDNLQRTDRIRIPAPVTVTWPYVDEGCCNLTTTLKCKNEGGGCIPRNETCVGKAFHGDAYCSLNHLKSCQCCVPANCEELDPCRKLNGTCSLTCPGKSVTGKEFCKDSQHCKCCLPEPEECPCGQDYNGGCKGKYSSDKWTYGICEKTCSIGTVELDHHTCNKTGGADCKCCGKEIPVPCEDTWPTDPRLCIDYINGGACGCDEVVRNGYCTNPIYVELAMYCLRSCGLCEGPCDIPRTTICPDRTRCHKDAYCIQLYGGGYTCKCKFGLAGDGYDCGEDFDLDSWPDVALECCLDNTKCLADNCPRKPNKGQGDRDYDGIGDECDNKDDDHTGPTKPTTTPYPDDGFCRPIKPESKCTNISDAWKTKDTDGDGHKDSCDNCPKHKNTDQADADMDGIGDACDDNVDTDNDGVDDSVDNCKTTVNCDQSDADEDGLGDKCDNDADGDGILNDVDNCWLVHNPGQEDADNNGVGNACEKDQDGDCALDDYDICPVNHKINEVDFNHFKLVNLDETTGKGAQALPNFTIKADGTEIYQNVNSKPGLMYGRHSFDGVNYEGTFVIDTDQDDDYAGFIFGYQNQSSFYVCMWKKKYQRYWEGVKKSEAQAGLQLKKVHSSTGPSLDLADALWATKNTANQVTLLWHDDSKIEWVEYVPYRWQLIHRPKIGLIRFRFMKIVSKKLTLIADSGNIFDYDIKGGRIGVYCHSQEDILWSDIEYNCNDDSVPQLVYDDLDEDKQNMTSVDMTKIWEGAPQSDPANDEVPFGDEEDTEDVTEPGFSVTTPVDFNYLG